MPGVAASGFGAGGAGVACLACLLGVVLVGCCVSAWQGGHSGEGMMCWGRSRWRLWFVCMFRCCLM